MEKLSRNERLLNIFEKISCRLEVAWQMWMSSCTPINRARLDKYNARYERVREAVLYKMGEYDYECTCSDTHTCEAHR